MTEPGTEAAAGGACAICGAPDGGAARCTRCGSPEVPAAAARGLADAVDLLATGALDAAIRKCRQAATDAPESWLVRARLAAAFERKAQAGEPALFRLADRELEEAARLAPAEREVHLARVALAVKTGRLLFLRAEYSRRREELACATECLRIIETLLQSGGVASALEDSLGAAALRSRFLFMGAVGAGIAGAVQMSAIVHAALQDEGLSLLEQGGFWVAALLLTGAGALAMEGWRSMQSGKRT